MEAEIEGHTFSKESPINFLSSAVDLKHVRERHEEKEREDGEGKRRSNR